MNKPILFNTEMVHAIMDGRKTVTRRVVKGLPKGTHLAERNDDGSMGFMYGGCNNGVLHDGWVDKRLPCFIGDILWVRETWTPFCISKKFCRNNLLCHSDYCYKASPEQCVDDLPCRWHPSIHMPKSAARIFLRVTDVRAERLQEITENESEKEGVPGITKTSCYGTSAIINFCLLWDSTITPKDIYKYGWDANPYVWVISFERCEKPEGFDS